MSEASKTPRFDEAGGNPVDYVARLSGVNFGSVVKVFVALELLARQRQCFVEDLTNLTLIPDGACVFGIDDDREHATEDMMAAMLNSTRYEDLKTRLQLRQRESDRGAKNAKKAGHNPRMATQ